MAFTLAATLIASVAGATEFPPAVPPPPPCQEINTDYTGDDCVADFENSDLDSESAILGQVQVAL